MAYEFTKELETGNALIDSQHRQLIEAINRLLEACGQGKGRAQIKETMDFLQQYTAKHFSDEESLQLKYGYPDYPKHKEYHEWFKKTVAELAAELEQMGPTVVMVGKVNASIAGWLVNHIRREDTRVAAHIRQKGGE